MCNTLDRLKKITVSLPNIPTLAGLIQNQNWLSREIATESGGPWKETLLYSVQDIAVSHDWAGKGSVAKEHVHPLETEYLLITKGIIKVEMRNENGTVITKVLRSSDCLKILPGIAHKCMVVEDIDMITVTIPAAEGMRINDQIAGA